MRVDEIISAVERMLNKREGTVLMEIEDDSEDPFKVLIGAMLSHRTRDEKTAEAVRNLFNRFKGLEELAEARPDEVAELIKSVGFYKTKSKRVVEVARIIRDRHGGVVPKNMEELLALPSVGRKTANCVLVYGYNMDAIPVDTHVHRIVNRIGIVRTKTPEETEKELMERIPTKFWREINDLFVRFGREVCKPVGPKCEACLIKGGCQYYKKVREK